MHLSTPKILLLILFTVCHTIPMKFREFGIESNNYLLIDNYLYSKPLSAWNCKEKFCLAGLELNFFVY